MYLKSVKLLPVTLPLRQHFDSNHERLRQRNLTLVQLINDRDQQAIGELEAFDQPNYNPETQATSQLILKRDLIPRLKHQNFTSPHDFQILYQDIAGQQMALSALEMPLWQLFAQQARLSLGTYLAQTLTTKALENVPVGISLGLNDWPDLQQSLKQAIQAGYTRFKFKVADIDDLQKIHKIRQLLPKASLMIDGNSAFDRSDWSVLQQLDPLNLDMIEQPLATTDFVDHAWLAKRIKTPICLDENILNLAAVKTATALGSAQIINLKPARVGGLTAALQILAYCQTHGLTCWVGGMVESDVGRYYSQSLARLAWLTYPGDVGPAKQFFDQQLCQNPVPFQKGYLHFTLQQQAPLLKTSYQRRFLTRPNLLA